MGLIGAVHGGLVFGRRTRVLGAALAGLLPDKARVLDVGCGDGTVARQILARRPDVQVRGIDVLVRPRALIPVERYDGTHIPGEADSCDVAMFVDVLHHTPDPRVLLQEARRVAAQRIVIKDHLCEGAADYATLRFMDWVGNAHHGVALPYNYWSRRAWQDAFADLGLRVLDWEERVALYPPPASLVFGRGLHFVAALATR